MLIFRLHDGDFQTLLDGMIVIDMVEHTSRNLSTSSLYNNQTRVGGVMEYVPGVGDNGVLVALGGQVFDGKRIITSHDKGRLLGFNTVEVFDLGSYLRSPTENGTWYSQPTSGNIPSARIDFCTIIASAPDNSSHNMYVLLLSKVFCWCANHALDIYMLVEILPISTKRFTTTTFTCFLCLRSPGSRSMVEKAQDSDIPVI